MKAVNERVREFLTSEAGPTVTEYAVMLALIILISLGGITLLGNKVATVFTSIKDSMPTGS